MGIDWDPFSDEVDQAYADAGAQWYSVGCDGGDVAYRWYVPGDEESPEVVLREVVEEAIGRVDAGIGRLRLAPADPAPHITGLPSWLAIDPEGWQTRTASVSAGAITVTAALEPQRVVWSLGDGGEQVCDGPGVVYDTAQPHGAQSTDCSYTYVNASTLEDPDGSYRVGAAIVYGASFTVTSPFAELNGTFDLGELTGPETAQDVIVREIQAVRTARH